MTRTGVGHAPAPAASPATAGGWRVLALLSLAQFMLIVDVTVVNVALPSIAADLSLGRAGLTWVLAAYSLAFGGLLLLGGRLADGLGRRRAFLIGLAIFVAASLLSGLAWSGGVLIAARAAQGVGAALLSPAALAIITTTFQGGERTRALGVWAAIGGSGAAIGVLLGGVLASGPGWEWIFFVNVPVGLAVLVLLPRAVAAVPGAGLSGVDVRGALTLTATAALTVLGLVLAGQSGWSAPATLIAFGGALVAAVVFRFVQGRTRQPIIPRGLFTRRPLAAGSAFMVVASVLLLGSFFLSSWYAQHLLGLSALQTGLVFLPVALGTVVGAHLAAHVLGRLGYRPVAVAAFALAAAGALLLSRLPANGSVWADLLPGFVLMSVALGGGFVTATTAAMHGVDHHEAGLYSGIVNTGHELGGALGVALATLLAGASLGSAAVAGFRTAFAGFAAVALITALAAWWLAPAGRPESSRPLFVH